MIRQAERHQRGSERLRVKTTVVFVFINNTAPYGQPAGFSFTDGVRDLHSAKSGSLSKDMKFFLDLNHK